MLGNFKSRVRDGTEQTINPIQIIRYWKYNDSDPQDDIMLIKLDRPAILNRKVQLLPPATRNVSPGTICTLSGLDWSQKNSGECTSHGKLKPSISYPWKGALMSSGLWRQEDKKMDDESREKLQKWSGKKRLAQKSKAPPSPRCLTSHSLFKGLAAGAISYLTLHKATKFLSVSHSLY